MRAGLRERPAPSGPDMVRSPQQELAWGSAGPLAPSEPLGRVRGRGRRGCPPPGYARAEGLASAACPAVGRAHVVTCLDPAAPQKLDHVLGEAWAQAGAEHAHVPWGPGASPAGIREALSRRLAAPLSGGWGGAGGAGAKGSCGTDGADPAGPPLPRAAPPLPASRLQSRADSATCWPRGTGARLPANLRSKRWARKIDKASHPYAQGTHLLVRARE